MPTKISVLDVMENLENNQWMWSYEERWKQLKKVIELQQAVNSEKERKPGMFSPAPWAEETTDEGDVFVVMDKHHKVLIGNLEDTCSVCHANARLIKSAPHLFHALEKAVEMMKIDLDAFGGCDHSVGVCNCDLKYALEDAERAIAEVKS